MDQRFSVDMDCNPDATATEIRSDAGKHNVTATLVDPNGPGGGCPVYRFTGTMRALRAYLKDCHNPGLDGQDLEEEVDFYLSTATPA